MTSGEFSTGLTASTDIAVIGGGAAGFFAAITARENFPGASVVIFEKSGTPLAKVSVSGGGRCNVTNACRSIKKLTGAYPRGGRELKPAFQVFNTVHAMEWFESRGVPLMIQDDQRVFPRSQRARTVVDCFMSQADQLGIGIELTHEIAAVRPIDDGYELCFRKRNLQARTCGKIIVATGGTTDRTALKWLEDLGHAIVPPVPSLFSFNIPADPITGLMGISVDNVRVSIQGTDYTATGGVLITHWGMSGPAILHLSAWSARYLSDHAYSCTLLVNWTGIRNTESVLDTLTRLGEEHSQKLLANFRPFNLPGRLWEYLLLKTGLRADRKWKDLGSRRMKQLLNTLTHDLYPVAGRGPHQDEFVTCGGVSLESVDMRTMRSTVCPDLYFAGEILDIDGITGGYNFQAAWTTAFIAAHCA